MSIIHSILSSYLTKFRSVLVIIMYNEQKPLMQKMVQMLSPIRNDPLSVANNFSSKQFSMFDAKRVKREA